MKTITKCMLAVLALCGNFFMNLHAQSAVGIGAQITNESKIVDGGKYILQSQASGTPYIVDAGTYYSVPNAGNSPTTATVYYFYKNDDGTWKIKNQHTGKYWGVPVYNVALVPAIEAEAGAWSLNFSGSIAYPTAPDAQGTKYNVDRSSQKMVAYTEHSSVAHRIKIFEVDAPLSTEPLPELVGKTVTLGEEAAQELEADKWYVMFDRGITDNKYAHGYLYEDANSHTLYNTATAPSGTASTVAQFLVRLSQADEGSYYIQNGFGNYFGAFTQGTVVPVVDGKTEPIVVAKIADTDGHFYLQSVSSGIILDANDVRDGAATVVGWGSSVPSAIGGNNDWAFNPVELEDIGEEVALFDADIAVTQGYQTTGRGNTDALLLRIDIVPYQNLLRATFNVTLDEVTRNNITALSIYDTKNTEFIANIPEAPLGQNIEVAEQMGVTVENLAAGTHHLWLCATVKDDATLGAILDAALTSIDYTTTKDVTLDVSAKGNPSRQGLKVFEQQHFVFRPTSDNCRYYRIPAMILDKDGNVVVAADKRYNSNSDLGNHKIDVVSLRSEDGGRTWQDYATVAVGDGQTAAYYGYGDAALARAENGDLVCIMAAGNKMWGSNATDGMKYAGFAKSSDNGKTWTLVKNLLASNMFTDENSADGSLSVANIFTTSGKGLTTNDGVIMFTTNCRTPGSSSPNLCYILYSTDNGASWRLSNALAYSGCDESKLEQLADGSLLLSVRQSGNRGWNNATYTKNEDGTVTFKWGTQRRTDYIWGNACNADILYYSRPSDTTPDIMLHCYINSSGRESLQIAMSMDAGKTWKNVYNIQPNGSCYSTMVALPSGDVALLYEDESYSAGNGYAINYVVLTKDQIIDWFVSHGGVMPEPAPEPDPEPEPEPEPDPDAVVNLQGAQSGATSVTVYNIAGQQMKQLRKGVNVVGNKKVVVK